MGSGTDATTVAPVLLTVQPVYCRMDFHIPPWGEIIGKFVLLSGIATSTTDFHIIIIFYIVTI